MCYRYPYTKFEFLAQYRFIPGLSLVVLYADTRVSEKYTTYINRVKVNQIEKAAGCLENEKRHGPSGKDRPSVAKNV